MASAPRCARTGPWCRTAPKGQRSGRAAPTPTRWQSKTDDGCSAIARSTASSPPEAGSNEDSGIAIWDVAIAREGETIAGGDRLRPPAPVADQTQYADEQCDRGSTGSGVNLGSGRDRTIEGDSGFARCCYGYDFRYRERIRRRRTIN